MGELADRLTAALNDIETEIAGVQARATADIARLEARKTALQTAQNLVTPQAEQAILGLKRLGIQI
jgi:hypothetical protein